MVDLCLYVTLPFNILNSFFVDWKWEMLISCSVILLLSVGYNAVSVFLSSVLFKKAPQDRKKTLRYGTIVSNGGFLGNPIIEGVYGTSGLFYASIFMIPVRIVMWSVGISVFLKGKRENILKKVLTHPCIIAVYVGAILMGTGVVLPEFLMKTISGLSSCNTPLSMMLVGMMLAEMNPRGLIDRTMLFYTGVRLIVIPGVVFLLTMFLDIDPLLRGIAVIMQECRLRSQRRCFQRNTTGDETYATGNDICHDDSIAYHAPNLVCGIGNVAKNRNRGVWVLKKIKEWGKSLNNRLMGIILLCGIVPVYFYCPVCGKFLQAGNYGKNGVYGGE